MRVSTRLLGEAGRHTHSCSHWRTYWCGGRILRRGSIRPGATCGCRRDFGHGAGGRRPDDRGDPAAPCRRLRAHRGKAAVPRQVPGADAVHPEALEAGSGRSSPARPCTRAVLPRLLLGVDAAAVRRRSDEPRVGRVARNRRAWRKVRAARTGTPSATSPRRWRSGQSRSSFDNSEQPQSYADVVSGDDGRLGP